MMFCSVVDKSSFDIFIWLYVFFFAGRGIVELRLGDYF